MEACGPNRVMTITVQNKTNIFSPNYPEKYKNNMNCTWRIVSDDTKRIEITLKGHELEEEYELYFTMNIIYFIEISNYCSP